MTTAASVALRHQAQQRRQQQHGGQRGAGRDQRGLLRLPADGAHHGRLRGAAAGRHRAEQRAADIGQPGGDQFAVGIDRRIARTREGAPGRDGFGEAHQRDAQRARHQLLDQRQIRQRERREALAGSGRPSRRPWPAGRRTTTRRCRRPPRPAAPANAATCAPCRSAPQRSPAPRPVSAARSRAVWCTTLATSRKKPCLVMWMPSSLGTWSSTITRPMPALKPVSTGVEMKFATKPRRSSRATSSITPTSAASVAVAVTSLAGVAVGHHQPELRAGQDRQRGGGADAEHARRTQQRVDQHRNEGRVQAHRHRQPGHGGIGHGLGQHHRCRDQAGDHVQAQRGCAWRGRRGIFRGVSHGVLFCRAATSRRGPRRTRR